MAIKPPKPIKEEKKIERKYRPMAITNLVRTKNKHLNRVEELGYQNMEELLDSLKDNTAHFCIGKARCKTCHRLHANKVIYDYVLDLEEHIISLEVSLSRISDKADELAEVKRKISEDEL